jgi:hypothetical protein
MRNDAQRIAKYLAKTVPATISLKVAAVLEGMRTNFGDAITDLVDIETQIQAICNTEGVVTIKYPFYLNFGREIWRRVHEGIDGPSLVDAAQSLHDKYVTYGLDTAVLVDITDQVFHITVS